VSKPQFSSEKTDKNKCGLNWNEKNDHAKRLKENTNLDLLWFRINKEKETKKKTKRNSNSKTKNTQETFKEPHFWWTEQWRNDGLTFEGKGLTVSDAV